MELLKKDLIFLDQDIKSRDDVFAFIAKQAKDKNIITSEDALVAGFKKRESEGTTGFEDGFAIPHARIKEAKEAAVVVVRLKKGIDWESIDGKPTEVAIALIVPDGQGNTHMEILSDVATKLMNEEFKKQIKAAKNADDVIKAFDVKKAAPKAVAKKAKDGLNILAITACITGVAHTYMAEEKLIKAGAEMGHHLRVETHGSKGVGTPFSDKEIKEADLVIYAVDVNVDKARFAGKKSYQVKVAKAIHDPEAVINDAQTKGTVQGSAGEVGQLEVKQRESVMKHILAGISYMIPVIVLGGICLAFSLGIAKAIWGPSAGTAGPLADPKDPNSGIYPWGPLNVISIIGGAAFTLMIPILAGFIGNSIAGRAAIAPAMVAAFIGNNNANLMQWIPGVPAVQTPLGFIGALIAGLAAGYLVKWINTWRIPRSLQAAMPIFFIPLFVGLLLSLVFIYVIGAPIGYVMQKVQDGIKEGYSGTIGIGVGLALGALLGAMGGFDMGGPVNKIAFVTCSLLVTQEIYEPMGSLAAAIPVAPLGMGFTTVFFPKFFDKDTKNMGIGAIIMGCIGISEGAIPFAIRDPKRAIVSNVLGSLVAGAIAGAFGVTDQAAHGGPIVAILGAVPYGVQTLYFFIAAAAGVVVTTSVYGFWLVADAGKPGSIKETHVAKLAQIRETYANKKMELDDAIKDVKNKLYTDKKAAKLSNENTSAIVMTAKQEIERLKAQLIEAKAVKKAAVLKAKTAYKETAKLEKAAIKSQSSEMKAVKLSAKDSMKNELMSISNNKKTVFTNKAEKVAYVKDVHENKVAAKLGYKDALVQDSISRREQYVKQYNKLAA
jgi:PTS system fructose-specific IIC component